MPATGTPEHYCLNCAYPIHPGQPETAVQGIPKWRPTTYIHKNWEDCQAALSAAEQVVWPSPLANPGAMNT